MHVRAESVIIDCSGIFHFYRKEGLTMNSLEDIWNVLMQNLSTQLTPTAISTWFSDCRPVELEEYRLVIRTTTQFKKKIISERFASAIKSSLSEPFSCE